LFSFLLGRGLPLGWVAVTWPFLQRKKFEIRAVGCPDSRKYTYYTSSDDKSKHLLYLCRVTHQFSMAMQPKLAELRKLEEEGELHSCSIAFDPVTNF
jgi:FERM C-terminal PH-like domain